MAAFEIVTASSRGKVVLSEPPPAARAAAGLGPRLRRAAPAPPATARSPQHTCSHAASGEGTQVRAGRHCCCALLQLGGRAGLTC